MHRLKSRGIITLAVIGLFAFSGIAMADTEDDTVFNYGYDEDSQFFFWNVTSLDYELEEDPSLEDLSEDCALEGEVDYSVEEGNITVEDYDEESNCNDFDGGSVLGPEGQVNHGMFLKLFNEQYDGTGNRGCLVRHIAQSDLGMDDQQVEADPDEPSDSQEIEGGTADFTTVETNCINGKPSDVDDAEAEGVGGPPQEVLDRFEDGTPGKPADVGGGRP